MFGGLIGQPSGITEDTNLPTQQDAVQGAAQNTQDAVVKHYNEQMQAQQAASSVPMGQLQQLQAPSMATIGQAAPPQALTPFDFMSFAHGGSKGVSGAGASSAGAGAS